MAKRILYKNYCVPQEQVSDGDKYYLEDSDAAVTANTWQYIGYTMVSSSGVGPTLTAYSNGTNRLMGSVGTDVSGVAEGGATGNFIIGRRVGS